MKFGLHNPSWVFDSDPDEMFEEVKRKAQWAESHGFAMFSVMDHFVQMPGIGAIDEPFMESWTTLAALAAVTSKIRLAILVSSVSFRNPALLAKMAANIDIISRGRLTLGIGAGPRGRLQAVRLGVPAYGGAHPGGGRSDPAHENDVAGQTGDFSRRVFPGSGRHS